jgi:putative transposase
MTPEPDGGTKSVSGAGAASPVSGVENTPALTSVLEGSESQPDSFQQEPGDLRYYLAWATRRRRPFLAGPILDRASQLFSESAASLEVRIASIESGGDYVTVTVDAPPHLSPAAIVERLKRHSAGALRREFPELQRLPSIWTRRFMATTHANRLDDRVAAFVAEQPRHERRRSVGS